MSVPRLLDQVREKTRVKHYSIRTEKTGARHRSLTHRFPWKAPLFLYREVLNIELPWLDDMQRAKKPSRLPVVLTRAEVRGVLSHLDGMLGMTAALG